MSRLNAVFKWNMTAQEAQVFRIAVLWEELTCRKYPGIRLARLPQRTDPRNSHLFRQCWKLMRSTRGLIKPEEMSLYITAQLQILRVNNGRIDPSSLSGDKAWVRWLLWKRLYDRKKSQMVGESPPPSSRINPMIMRDLGYAKKMIFEACDGAPSLERMKQLLADGRMRNWVSSRRFTPLYFMVSPWTGHYGGIDKLSHDFQFDPGLYRVDDCIRRYFESEFDYEFNSA